MYTVIGVDGLQYGPVSLETLKQWLGEGRLEAGSRVLVHSINQWKLLSELPAFRAPPAPPAPPSARRANGFATAGLVCGLVSLTFGFCCCNGFPLNVAGVVFSLIALADLRREPGRQSGVGLAMAGLITSGLSVLLAIVFCLIFLIAGAVGSAGRWHGW